MSIFTVLVLAVTTASDPIPDSCRIDCRDDYLTCLFACEWEEEPALSCDAAYAECRADCDPPVAAPPAPSASAAHASTLDPVPPTTRGVEKFPG